MEAWTYEVVSIDGDYANLRRTDVANIGACHLEQGLVGVAENEHDPMKR